MNVYEAGYKAWKAGAIPTADMSLEGATVKLAWCLAQTPRTREIKKMFNKNYVGEIRDK